MLVKSLLLLSTSVLGMAIDINLDQENPIAMQNPIEGTLSIDPKKDENSSDLIAIKEINDTEEKTKVAVDNSDQEIKGFTEDQPKLC